MSLGLDQPDLVFSLYARLIGDGLAPTEAYDMAIEAFDFWMRRTSVDLDDGGERAAQSEEKAWAHFQKVKSTAERLLADPSARPEYNQQLAESVAEAEKRWRAFGTFRLREALGQYQPYGVFR